MLWGLNILYRLTLSKAGVKMGLHILRKELQDAQRLLD